MKKKLFFLASALTVLAACSNNDDVPAPEAEGQEPIVIDLNALSYEDVMTRLSETNSLKNVKFVDGDVVKIVSELKASDNIDPMQADFMVFNSANAADSLELSISPDYLTVNSIVAGERLAYTAYADAAYQAKLTDFYAALAPATTRSGEATVTRSANGASMKMNMNALQLQLKARVDAGDTSVMSAVPPALPENAATRGWFSNLFKKIAAAFAPKAAPVVKTPTVDIYLLSERGANPLVHEMNWQANDAVNSLKKVQGNVKFNIYNKRCGFQGSMNAYQTMDEFKEWCDESREYRDTKGVFVLCRWGSWTNVLGMANSIGDYNVNDDTQGHMISCTNAWNKWTMAHEMGHIFGAWHVSAKWWQIFWSADLMCTPAFDWLGSGKHKDDANCAEIKKNLTLN